MVTNESKNEMLVTVLTDLAAICQKLAENSAVPEELRVQARKLVEQFNSLLPVRGKGTADQHFEGEQLITRTTRFLPRVLEVRAAPPFQRIDNPHSAARCCRSSEATRCLDHAGGEPRSRSTSKLQPSSNRVELFEK